MSEEEKSVPRDEDISISEKPPFSLLHEIAFVALIASAQALTQSGLAQAVAPLHIIGAHFGTTNPGQMSWYAAGYSLTVGTFILIAGRLGDMHGHKTMFMGGWLWFGIWSVLAGVSYFCSSQIFFIICRACQGIGPAFLLPNALAILGRTYPEGKRKHLTFSIFGGTAPGGFLIGAVFSGIFAQYSIWAWAYWVLAIVCFLLVVVSYFIIPSRSEKESLEAAGQKFDYLGSITGVTGLVLFNIAWNQGPSVGWHTPYAIVFLIVGLMFICLFILIESKVEQPILPLDMLNKSTCFVLACIAAGWSSFGIWFYYSWQFMEDLRLASPLVAAAQFSPAAISGMCAALTTAWLMPRFPATAIMALAMLFFLIAAITCSTMPVKQTYWAQLFVATVVAPWGMDMSFPAGTLILSSSVPREHQGIAASLVNTVVNYSISIGLGIAGTVQVHVNDGGKDLLKGYRGAWYTGIGLSGFGVVISCTALIRHIWRERNRRIFNTKPRTLAKE